MIERIVEGFICAGLRVTEAQPGAEGLDAGQELGPYQEAGWHRKPGHGGGLGQRGRMRSPHRRAPELLLRNRLRIIVSLAGFKRGQHNHSGLAGL